MDWKGFEAAGSSFRSHKKPAAVCLPSIARLCRTSHRNQHIAPTGDGLAASTWFADESAFTYPRVNFSTYSNERALIAFNRAEFVECTLRPGALVIVGSGAPRNVTDMIQNKDSYSWYSEAYLKDGTVRVKPEGTIIDMYQEAEPQFVQYIFNPALATKHCSYWEMDTDDVWNSKEKNEEVPFLKNGKYLLEQ